MRWSKLNAEEVAEKKRVSAERKAAAVELFEREQARVAGLLPTVVFMGFGPVDGYEKFSHENKLMVLVQQEAAGFPLGEPVAEFRVWLRAGRAVKKGSKALYVDNGRGGLSSVFSFSQTDPAKNVDVEPGELFVSCPATGSAGAGGSVGPVKKTAKKTAKKATKKKADGGDVVEMKRLASMVMADRAIHVRSAGDKNTTAKKTTKKATTKKATVKKASKKTTAKKTTKKAGGVVPDVASEAATVKTVSIGETWDFSL